MPDSQKVTGAQELPVRSDQPTTYDLIRKDLDARQKHGTEKYGQAHQAHNGRNQLIDAYQENLDLSVYLRAEIEERRWSPALTCSEAFTLFTFLDAALKESRLDNPALGDLASVRNKLHALYDGVDAEEVRGLLRQDSSR
jgi:hypothetical protein